MRVIEKGRGSMLVDIYGYLAVMEAGNIIVADIEFWVEVRREYVVLLGPETCEAILEEKQGHVVEAIRAALPEFLGEKWKITDFHPRPVHRNVNHGNEKAYFTIRVLASSQQSDDLRKCFDDMYSRLCNLVESVLERNSAML